VKYNACKKDGTGVLKQALNRLLAMNLKIRITG